MSTTEASVTPQAFGAVAFGAVPHYPGRVHDFLEMLGWRHFKVGTRIIVDPETCKPKPGYPADLDMGIFRIRASSGVYAPVDYKDPTGQTPDARVFLYAPCSRAFQAFQRYFANAPRDAKGMTAEEAGAHEWSVVSAWDLKSRVARIESALERHEDTRSEDLKDFGYLYRIKEDVFFSEGITYFVLPDRSKQGKEQGLKRIFCLASMGKVGLQMRTLEPYMKHVGFNFFLRQVGLSGRTSIPDTEVVPIILNDFNQRSRAFVEGLDPRKVPGDDYFLPHKRMGLIRLAKILASTFVLNYAQTMRFFTWRRFGTAAGTNLGFNFVLGLSMLAQAKASFSLWAAVARGMRAIMKAAQTTTSGLIVTGGYRDRGDRTTEFWSSEGLPLFVNSVLSRPIDPEKVPHLRPVRLCDTELRQTVIPVRRKDDPALVAEYILDTNQAPGCGWSQYQLHGQILNEAREPNGLLVTDVPCIDASVACMPPGMAVHDADHLPRAVTECMMNATPEKPYLYIDRSFVSDVHAFNGSEEEAKNLYAKRFMSAAEVTAKLTKALKVVPGPDVLLTLAP